MAPVRRSRCSRRVRATESNFLHLLEGLETSEYCPRRSALRLHFSPGHDRSSSAVILHAIRERARHDRPRPRSHPPARATAPGNTRPATRRRPDIVALVLAIVIPIAGLVVALAASRRAHRLGRRASGLTVAALIIAVVLLILQIAGAAVGLVLVNRSVQAARDAPECAAIKAHSDLLTTSGPSAMYKILYTDALGSASGQRRYVIDTFNADIADFERWHQEVPQLVSALPAGSDTDTLRLADAVKALDYLVNPGTGAWGDDPTNEKSWHSIGTRVDTIKQWRSDHCEVAQ